MAEAHRLEESLIWAFRDGLQFVLARRQVQIHFSGLPTGQFPTSVSLEVIPTANRCLLFLNVFITKQVTRNNVVRLQC